MLKIGDFSKLANVTVKALRHYAVLGLLRPAWTDRFTGYRYYSLEQLPRLNRILALKDLGLSLEQVRRVLDSSPSPEELRGMLHLKQAELQQRLIEEQQRLARVEARLKQIEQEGHLHVEAVVVRPVEALPVAYMRLYAAQAQDVAGLREQARAEIERALERAGIVPTGPWLSIQSNGEYMERDIPVEVAVRLDHLPPRHASFGPRVMLRSLPALEFAAVYPHTGGEDTLAQAYATLYGWIESNGYRINGPAREVHLVEKVDDPPIDVFYGDRPPAAPVTCIEVQLPLEPAAHPRKESDMEPEIIEFRELLVAGTEYIGSNANQEIAEMWGKEFNPRYDEIKRVSDTTFGVCEMDESLPDGQFRYVAAAEIARPEDAPPDLVHMRVPAGKYAVFKHIGALENLHKTYVYIYQVWMPQSGYKRANRPDLELYTEEFNDFQPDSVMYLYVPIE